MAKKMKAACLQGGGKKVSGFTQSRSRLSTKSHAALTTLFLPIINIFKQINQKNTQKRFSPVESLFHLWIGIGIKGINRRSGE